MRVVCHNVHVRLATVDVRALPDIAAYLEHT